MEKSSSNIRYVVVAVAVCLMACGTMGLPNAYGVFYTPMSEALGSGLGPVTMHMSISNLAIGLFTPIVARSLAHGHKMRNVLMVASALVLVRAHHHALGSHGFPGAGLRLQCAGGSAAALGFDGG